jgi:hypothetical protein
LQTAGGGLVLLSVAWSSAGSALTLLLGQILDSQKLA